MEWEICMEGRPLGHISSLMELVLEVKQKVGGFDVPLGTLGLKDLVLSLLGKFPRENS